MIRRDRSNERLVALFLLGALLLLPPLLLIFNRPERILGIPLLYLYIFAVWASLIVLAALIAHRIDRHAVAATTNIDVSAGDEDRNGEALADEARRA
jgi:fatty acid desaturase